MCLSAGNPIASNIAEVYLKQGDVLIVEAGPEFQANFKNNRAFSLISEVPKSSPMKRGKMWIALLITVAMVTTQVGAWAVGCAHNLMRWGVKLELTCLVARVHICTVLVSILHIMAPVRALRCQQR
jgi:branched-subunit amino acid permease